MVVWDTRIKCGYLAVCGNFAYIILVRERQMLSQAFGVVRSVRGQREMQYMLLDCRKFADYCRMFAGQLPYQATDDHV